MAVLKLNGRTHFISELDFHQSNDLVQAIDAALSAMVNYGSDELHMTTLSLLRLTAMKQRSDYLNRQERDRS